MLCTLLHFEVAKYRSELILAIVEKPKYNSDGRRPTKVTHEMMNEIEALLELNRKKRAEWKHKETFIRQEYDYDDVCEFDWEEVKLNIGNEGFKKYQMAVFTEAKSNHRFAMLFRTQNTLAVQQSHAEFFKHCKGFF